MLSARVNIFKDNIVISIILLSVPFVGTGTQISGVNVNRHAFYGKLNTHSEVIV